jgi:uncharacterized OB-fold protein
MGLQCQRCRRRISEVTVFCPECGSSELLKVVLPTEGEIVSFTVQKVAPSPFNEKAPYAWIIVQLTDGTRTTGIIYGSEKLQIGDKVHLISETDVRIFKRVT